MNLWSTAPMTLWRTAPRGDGRRQRPLRLLEHREARGAEQGGHQVLRDTLYTLSLLAHMKLPTAPLLHRPWHCRARSVSPRLATLPPRVPAATTIAQRSPTAQPLVHRQGTRIPHVAR